MEIRNLLKYVKKNLPIFLIIIIAAAIRVIPHPPNFAPIGGLALFSGAYLKDKRAFVIPLGAMIISDLIIGLHDTMIYVYVSFGLIVIIGSYLRKNQHWENILGATLISSILFFVITNFGVWASSEMYAHTASGLRQAYVMAIPFFRNTVLGDVVYSLSFFYGYRLIMLMDKNLALSKARK